MPFFNLLNSVSDFGKLISLVTYIFTAMGLFTLAQRRKICNPWLAWIPVAQLWVLGSLSDQYQRKVHHRTTRRRRLLILLTALLIALVFIVVAMCLGAIFGAMTEGFVNGGDMSFWLGTLANLGGAMVAFVAILVAGIALVVLRYMALYDVYRSCEPSNATLFLILSIFFSFAAPVCLMLCRDKDNGMPAVESVPEPWEND